MAAIDISGLRHVYANGHVGLEDINLTVHDGEFLALLGPSGSGKTTLLRSIAGFLRPDAGILRIGGTCVAGGGAWVPPERRELGMVFQNHAIWPHWSVARNVGYPLKLARVPWTEAAARVQAILEKVGLAELGSRSPAALSGGQRQRVALARALVGFPQALLLDEALSSLDEPLRARLRLELKTLTRDQGLTAIHVTHDRAEALALADRVVVLNNGRIEQIGTPQQLLHEPDSAFVARFVSDATLFEGTLSVQAGVGKPVLELAGLSREVPTERLRVVRLPASDRLAPGRSSVTAAVTPHDLKLQSLDSSSNSGAVISSSLYGPHGFDVSADWHGIPIRSHVSDWIPQVGDIVQPTVLRAHVFCGEPTAGDGAERARVRADAEKQNVRAGAAA